jgi:hypothetical protein
MNTLHICLRAAERQPFADRMLSNRRFAPIVLKNPKIAGLRKSRKCRMLAISAAARLCRIDTSVSVEFSVIGEKGLFQHNPQRAIAPKSSFKTHSSL